MTTTLNRRRLACLLMAWATALSLQAATVFETDFSKAEVGKVPDDLLVLDGQFAVKEEGGNRFLELPDSPLETFGVMFGPSQKDGLTVTARMWSTGKGRRFPTFAVSVGGVSGFRLQVAPAKKMLELAKGDSVVASVPFAWTSGQWTHLRLQLRKTAASAWVVQGRAWLEGTEEPKTWAVTKHLTEEPVAGKAGLWGAPFAGTLIRFDDIKVETE